MINKNRSGTKVWVAILILSILFLAWTVPLLLLSGGTAVLEQVLSLAGSSLLVTDLDQTTLGSLNMAMLKPLWEELWIGVFGLYCAINLKQGKKHAWTLGLFWGIMFITNGVIQGSYELVVLNWSKVCLQTYLSLLIGVIAVVSLLITRKRYFGALQDAQIGA